ncbi:hypothetical protein GGP72_000154 [Salinibacter ruber]|uniref:Secreted protein n=1 Tax=Salinibacter ruber TaxID=146919 RepID=A0A9X2TAA6_9BACT|nr:hypothetical protein [Salinibacter ruber]MCS3676258.1 hypothetical protein [Salinibacter ruber]MCS3679545.1 hypothetical protein [Salinibacter ruber]
MRSMLSIRKRLATTLNVVVLGLLLLVPASPHAAEVVLCLEESGQVNVERAEVGECEGSRVGDSGEVNLLDASKDEHCIDCSDVPLRLTEADDPCGTALLTSSTSLEGPSEDLSLLSTGPESQTVDSEKPTSPAPLRFRRSNGESGRDTSLSSVVLLI